MCCNDTMCTDFEYTQIQNLAMQFPFISNKNNVIWLDNSATTQKPMHVINGFTNYYSNTNSNIHRGSHRYANISTELYEKARTRMKKYLNTDNLIFTRGTTESINLLANVLPINYGDTILLTEMEHHSNIVPWQVLAKKSGALLDYVKILDSGDLDMIDFYNKIKNNVAIFSFTHVSNVLGTVNDVKFLTKCAKKYCKYVIIDGAQSLGHMKVDINEIGCDFYVSSCHKMFGPFGVGLLCSKNDSNGKNIMDNLPPWQVGGGMIQDVTFENTIYSSTNKFEAGTPNVADVIVLNNLLDFLQYVPWNYVEKYEKNLLNYCINKMQEIKDLVILGHPKNKISVISFIIKNKNLTEIAKKLNANNIIIRLGHHCSQPTLRHYGYEQTLRLSFALYNTFIDVDTTIHLLKQI